MFCNCSMKDNADAIAVALKKDLGKGEFESNLMEIDWITNSLVFANNNLKTWAKDETAPDVPLTDKLMSPKIRKDPYGAVLIIGSVRLCAYVVSIQCWS